MASQMTGNVTVRLTAYSNRQRNQSRPSLPALLDFSNKASVKLKVFPMNKVIIHEMQVKRISILLEVKKCLGI